jgi:hypothetical protein
MRNKCPFRFEGALSREAPYGYGTRSRPGRCRDWGTSLPLSCAPTETPLRRSTTACRLVLDAVRRFERRREAQEICLCRCLSTAGSISALDRKSYGIGIVGPLGSQPAPYRRDVVGNPRQPRFAPGARTGTRVSLLARSGALPGGPRRQSQNPLRRSLRRDGDCQSAFSKLTSSGRFRNPRTTSCRAAARGLALPREIRAFLGALAPLCSPGLAVGTTVMVRRPVARRGLRSDARGRADPRFGRLHASWPRGQRTSRSALRRRRCA